jgi:hypothetical protein
MPDNMFYNLLFRRRNLAQGKITTQEKQQPAWWVSEPFWK